MLVDRFIFTGIAKPTGAHGQGTVRDAKTNVVLGFMLVGGPLTVTISTLSTRLLPPGYFEQFRLLFSCFVRLCRVVFVLFVFICLFCLLFVCCFVFNCSTKYTAYMKQIIYIHTRSIQRIKKTL